MAAAPEFVQASEPTKIWNWKRINLTNSIGLFLIEAGVLAVLFVGISWPAAIAAWCVYWIQIFGVSAGYHRYFAHRTFRTSRAFQFALAYMGAMAAQMGPLWWSSYHRRHHAHSDEPDDIHSPRQGGFWWAHIGWVLFENGNQMDERYVKDWARYPELRWLDNYRWVPPASVLVVMIGLGAWLQAIRPEWGTSPWQMAVWGFSVSTTLIHHVTFSVNSVTHMFGRRRFSTKDDSRNVWWLALLTNGEGWHNNHHRFPMSEKHGLKWWEVDITHYVLCGLQRLGVVWGIRTQPAGWARSDK